MIAPVLGGALTTWFGWQAIFLVNVPIGLVGVALVWAFVPDDGDRVATPLDVVGTVALVLALSISITAMSGLAQPGALAVDLVLLVAGSVFGVLALWWFRRVPHPLVDLAALRVPTFVTAALAGGNTVRVAISATPFLLPLMVQEAWGLTPLEAGNIVLVYMAGNLVMKTVTTPTLKACGFRSVAVGNGLVVAGSIAALGLLTSETPLALVWVVAFVAGASRSLQFSALNTLAFADVEPEQRTSASTLFSIMQQVALAVGVALAAIVLSTAGGARNDHLSQADFTIAFVITAAVALVGALHMLGLARDAGHLVTGHQPGRGLRQRLSGL